VAQDRLLTLEKDRVRAGEDSPSETVTAEQARIDVEQQQAQLKATVNVAQAAAAKALGLPPDALDAMMFVWPEWGTPPLVSEQEREAAREQALLSRADLGVAIGDYAIAEAHLKLAVARQYPQITLNPGYYWDHGIAKFPFDVGFTLPVNGNKGEIAEARGAREVAGKHLLALQATIYGEISAAERAENLARTGAETAERRLETARRQLQQSDLGVRLGETDVLERVGAEILSIRAQLEVVEMQERLQGARNDLEDVLHTPLSGPEMALAKAADGLAPGVGS
jgi:outer membrane protein, heavy metal efflux system